LCVTRLLCWVSASPCALVPLPAQELRVRRSEPDAL
jgi:hypothetical protein